MFKKNFIGFLVFFLIAFLLIAIVSIKYRKDYSAKGMVFTTVGVKFQKQAFEHVQGAMYFAETIQGWLKNPNITDQISSSVSAYKQERQNMVIEVNGRTYDEVQADTEKLLGLINKRVNDYNRLTGAGFILITDTPKIITTASSSILFLVFVSVLGGIVSGVFFISIKESNSVA